MPQSRHQKIRRLLLFGALGIGGILLLAWWFNKHGPNAAATATGTASGNVLGGGAGFGGFTSEGNDLGAGTSPGGGDGAAGQQLTGAGTGLGTTLTLNIFSNAPATPTVTPVHTNPLIQPAPQAPAARAMPTAAAFVPPAASVAASQSSPPVAAAQAPSVAWFQAAAPQVAAVAAAGPTRGYTPPPPVNNIGLPARTGTVGRPTTNVAQQPVRVPVNVTRNLAPSGGAATIGTRRF